MPGKLLFLHRFHGRVGWLGVVVLMLPILSWVWLAAKEPVLSVLNGSVPGYVLTGKMFSEQFDTRHAGFVLDQPTIGKWLFWFSVMAASSLPYAAAVGWLANRKSRAGHLAFGTAASVLGFFLLCILSWPVLWLIQYVCSMGFTPRRAYGLAYSAAGGLLVLAFLFWAARRPRNAQPESRP